MKPDSESIASGEIGSSRRPHEDVRLVQGQGTYVGDLRLPGMLFVAFVRSQYAHARIARLRIEAAAAAPGVQLVLTGADLPKRPATPVPPGSPIDKLVAQQWLAEGIVRAVGEPIAAIVAESDAAAVDAAALVEVDYEPLPVVVDPVAALAPDAPLVHPELGTNAAGTLRRGTGDVAAAFARADRVVSARISVPRIAAVPLEPLGIVASWDPPASQLTVWCTTQAPWRLHPVLRELLGLSAEQVRVIAPNVGGGFGVRAPVYGEYVVVAVAAHRLGRSVRWLATRREDFLVTQGSRETIADVELAATSAGRFVAVRARIVTNLGAYAVSATSAQRMLTLMTGAYDIPVASVEISPVYTNTCFTGAYRGAGRPEAAYVVEQLVEAMADALAIDPIELRRRNFVKPDAFPYANALGATYDSGDYAGALDRALALVDYASLRREQADRHRAGDSELLGIGVASYVEPTGGGWESGRVRVEPDGRVVAITGSVGQGQDHETTFAQIVADRLGVRFGDVQVRQGDTADGLPGVGTFGSRSTALGGGALAVVADEVYERARRIAAHLLEAAPADVVARDGRFSVVGVSSGDRSIAWSDVAAAATGGDLPPDLAGPLDARTQFDMRGEAFAAGSCVAVVTVDRATGAVRLRRLALVHDCGTAINPRLVEAQVHGGLAQGAGEALGEWLRFDDEGQLLAGSLMDYWVPHADELPAFEHADAPSPSPLNRLGAKGVGEAGTIGAPPAILHAVRDALRHLGAREIDLPLTPERVWQAL